MGRVGFIMIIVYAIIGALLNRWRGGGWPFIWGEIHGGPNDHKRTQVRRIVFAGGLGLLAWSPWMFLVAYLSTLTGWGYPVSTAIGKKGLPIEKEWLPLDTLCIQLKQYPQTYGVAWLTMHGALFGGLAAFLTGCVWVLPLWASMGLCYYIARDWEYGEYLHGAMLGIAVFLACNI